MRLLSSRAPPGRALKVKKSPRSVSELTEQALDIPSNTIIDDLGSDFAYVLKCCSPCGLEPAGAAPAQRAVMRMTGDVPPTSVAPLPQPPARSRRQPGDGDSASGRSAGRRPYASPQLNGSPAGITEMPEPQAKKEGRLREARYLTKESVVLELHCSCRHRSDRRLNSADAHLNSPPIGATKAAEERRHTIRIVKSFCRLARRPDR